ncbi:hypothetical protein BsWGS_00476 [Bradybaena similaris]
MEFGPQVLENITLAGDAAHIPDKSFTKLVTCACQGVLNEDHRNIVEENPAFKDINKGVLKAAFGGLVTLVIEATKHDSNEQNISSLLEECKYTADKINEFSKVFLPQKPHIQLLLGKIGSSFPHIVDVDWRLDYYIKNNNVEKVNSGVYLISLKTEIPGEHELKDFQFSCTVEQLQDLVGKLRDATKSMEKIAQV